jgi:hypothetical protein
MVEQGYAPQWHWVWKLMMDAHPNSKVANHGALCLDIQI